MDRMATVDRNIIRAAVAEFLAYPSTPKAVVINEALEIARKFSGPESVQFINGVLDSVGRELENQTSGSSLQASVQPKTGRHEL
jgi:transcription antitermination protein NusB